MRQRLGWLDNNLLVVLAGILLVFIPLYPKIPLADILPGYIVRVRPEDLLIFVAGIVWFVQVVRRKVVWKSRVAVWMGAYLVVGALSALLAIYVTKTVPYETVHLAKIGLHYFRRIEYFMLFFIFFGAVKTLEQARRLILLIIPVTLVVTLYGYGQKYLYWPVYSTMNREFSKGLRLYLTEHARVPSTFGGHYDAAAYMMIALTILLSLTFLTAKRFSKVGATVVFVLGYWLLILTGSRTSIVAYLAAMTVFFVVTRLKLMTTSWALKRWMLVLVFSVGVMQMSEDLADRFDQVLRLERHVETIKSSFLDRYVKKPEEGISMEELETQVIAKSDQLPEVAVPTQDRVLPPDVYEDIPENPDAVAQGAQPIVRTWSENAEKYGLSVAIRLDALWPRAIAGFLRNPLFGSGYSTLTKDSLEVFTEAESTDNDFLRALGETGIFGFVTFFGTIVILLWRVYTHIDASDKLIFTAFRIGFIAASIGLLINALYIDVFESSKVAESYWALAGLAMAIGVLQHREPIRLLPVGTESGMAGARSVNSTRRHV